MRLCKMIGRGNNWPFEIFKADSEEETENRWHAKPKKLVLTERY